MTPEQVGEYLAKVRESGVTVTRIEVQTSSVDRLVLDIAPPVPEVSAADMGIGAGERESLANLGELLRSIHVPRPSAG